MKKIAKNKKMIIIATILMIFNYFIIFNQFYENLKANKTKPILIFSTISLFFTLITILLIKFNNSKNVPYHKLFFKFGLCYGILYIIFIPAMLGTDELPHFLRPYQLSVGDIFIDVNKDTTKMPKELLNFVSTQDMRERYTKESVINQTNYKNQGYIWNGNVTSINYSPISYLPQIIGFWIARLFKLSPLLTIYIVRFMNFICWLLILTYSIKIIPTRKISNIIFLISPAIISLVTSCNIDALPLASMILFVSKIFEVKSRTTSIEKKDKIILLTSVVFFSTYKLIYILLTLMLFILPKDKFKNKKERLSFILSLIIFGIILDIGWYSIAPNSATDSMANEQIKYVLSNPIKYVYIIVNSYINDVSYFLTNMFGGSEMCYGLVKINEVYIYGYIIIYIISLINEKNKISMSKCDKILMASSMILIILLISSAMYAGWTATQNGIGTSKIIGLQARYYYIVFFSVINTFNNKKITNISSKSIINIALLINLLMIFDVFKSLIIGVL